MTLQDHVFRALADPTRRSILLMLADGDRTVGEVASRFDMTRPAVAKHLKVLGDVGLVTVEARGRERINRLNPEPLAQVAQWVARFGVFWDARLAALKTEVETKDD